ncbi:multicopper oxidase domain-containing protein [Moorena sp. SIO2C4]|uniref:multicopper oxidase family protein n=1 Tax=Moorena sp. SIO2C4 TaxID=2607824 RepID=UPI0013CBAE90|nr:multicopper oxidase domain-containing protein [Moorena sp. SIO2C4]NES44569.1 multicopper oxidase domain-containing protein [Moorena sp. SIO2C4]
MKDKLQFLRKLLIATLISIFVLVSSFPGEVHAVSKSLIELNQRIDLRKAPTGRNFRLPRPVSIGEKERIAAEGECEYLGKKDRKEGSNPPLKYPQVFDVGNVDTQFITSETKTITIGGLEFGDINGDETTEGNSISYYQISGSDSKSSALPTTDQISPTIKVTPNQTINLELKNILEPIGNEQDTTVSNFHYHGFHVSPQVGSDNVLMKLPGSNYSDSEFDDIYDGETAYEGTVTNNQYTMEVKVPSNHQPGLNWFHAHPHGNTYDHVRRGLAGTIIVDGIQDYYTFLKNGFKLADDGDSGPIDQNQVMVFQNLTTLTNYRKDETCKKFIINNQYQPSISIQPGEIQFWRLANLDPVNYLNLVLAEVDGDKYVPQPLFVLALDSYPTTQPLLKKSILLPPGSRAEVLVGVEKLKNGKNYELISINDEYTFNDPDYPGYTLISDSISSSYENDEDNFEDVVLYRSIATITPSGEAIEYQDFNDSDSFKTYIGNTGEPLDTQGQAPWRLLTPQKLLKVSGLDVYKPDKQFEFSFTDRNCQVSPDSNSPYCEGVVEFCDNETFPGTPYEQATKRKDCKRVRVFTIEDKGFGEKGANQIAVHAGLNEDWTLINATTAPHTFHIHQTHFVVTTYDNGTINWSPSVPTYRDNINLPPNTTVTVRIPFTDTEIVTGGRDVGEFVFHCHILVHEDGGMMRKVCASENPEDNCVEN